LATIDARREAALVAVAEANLEVARAELERVLAGTGEEEIQASARALEAAGAVVEAQRARVERLRDWVERPLPARGQRPGERPANSARAVPAYAAQPRGQRPSLEEATFQLQSREKQYEAARKRHEALRRGPLPEEVQTARAAVGLAEKRLDEATTNYGYRRVVAPFSGTVLKVYRHKGDSVQAGAPTPLLRIADTSQLRVRLEVDEREVGELRDGMEGEFTARGTSEPAGRVEITQKVPVFGPKRLFNPDTSARLDTRTLEMLCDVTSHQITLYPGQRITAQFVPASADTSL
jgi:multidrug resistance efflux pump